MTSSLLVRALPDRLWRPGCWRTRAFAFFSWRPAVQHRPKPALVRPPGRRWCRVRRTGVTWLPFRPRPERLPTWRGRAIGGSSAIDAMVFARGHREGSAAWAENGVTGWSFDDRLPFFKRSETAFRRDRVLRGGGGPMIVSPANPPNPVLVACLCAALQRGYGRAKDPWPALPLPPTQPNLRRSQSLSPSSRRRSLDVSQDWLQSTKSALRLSTAAANYYRTLLILGRPLAPDCAV
jgi:choline dehydrogenase-like flavoprotein